MVLIALIAVVAGGIGTGRIAVEVTHGVSMQPTYHTGDLVVVARASSYHKGEIVAYHGGQDGHLVVLHRIIGTDPSGGFVIKGDNNQSIDPTHPVAEQLIGREVLHIPRVGVALRSPVARGLLVLALLGLVTVLIKNPRTQPAGADGVVARAPRRPARIWKALVVVDVALLVAVALSFALASQAPLPVQVASTQTGVLTYQAKVPLSDTYPTGRIETGDPVFVKLLKSLGVSFRYSTHAPAGSVLGVGRLDVVLSEVSGWHTSFAVAPPTRLVAGTVDLTGTLDLVAVQSLANRVAKATGVSSGTLDITVTGSARVSLNGAKPVTYSSQLPLELTPLELTLSGAKPISSTYGPAVTSTVALSPASPASSHSSGSRSHELRLGLLAAFLLALGATVVAVPTSGDNPKTPVAASVPGAVVVEGSGESSSLVKEGVQEAGGLPLGLAPPPEEPIADHGGAGVPKQAGMSSVVHLPDELSRRLEAAAAERGVSADDLASELIADGLPPYQAREPRRPGGLHRLRRIGSHRGL